MRFYLIIVFSILTLPSFAKNINVSLIIPDGEGPIFWQLVSEVSMAAATNLNVDLEIIHHDSHRFASKVVIDEISQRKVKPDYVVFFPFIGNVKGAFDQLEFAKIPFVTLEQIFTSDVKKAVGDVREKYKYWLGQIVYDNRSGGELLVETMIKAHKKKYPNDILYITGIGGDYDGVAQNRQAVLKDMIEEKRHNGVIVNQIFPMYWNPTMIHDRFPLMQQRYPKTNAYWCASDQMALEIFRENQAMNGSPMIIGGFDWIPSALKKIKNKEITASVGGHFLMVAQALLKIVDYNNGADRFLTPPLLQQYEVITINNVDQYLPFLENKHWTKVDFSEYLFSKHNKLAPILTVKNLIIKAK